MIGNLYMLIILFCYKNIKFHRVLTLIIYVFAACVSPADINAEETLNTLKYANRARNIQNKPVVNRDPMSSEMLRMRQQLECLQAELCARGGGSPVELQVFFSTCVIIYRI